jgi:GT2 family glycosyltransferase
MDDDAWAEPRWLAELLTGYSDPRVVAVGGAAVPYYETARPPWFPQNFDWVFGCTYAGLPDEPSPVRHLVGSNMSVRRMAFTGVGGFHGDDFDDLNLCMRLADQFGSDSILYTPRSVVHHYVTAQRVTWKYFRRRCYFVNREKVRVFRNMGGAANMAAEREFVLRAATSDVPKAVWRGVTEDRANLLSAGAMVTGIALAGLGNLSGRLIKR